MKKKLLWSIPLALGAALLGSTLLPHPAAEAGCWRPYYSAEPDGDPKCNCKSVQNQIGYESCFVIDLQYGGTDCVYSFPCAGPGPVPQ